MSFTQELATLICDRYNSETKTYECVVVTDDLKKTLKPKLADFDYDSFYLSKSTCECCGDHYVKKSIWDAIGTYLINFDLFRWMVEEVDFFPIDKDVKVLDGILQCFQKMLFLCGTGIDAKTIDRGFRILNYIFEWLRTEVPHSVLTWNKSGQTCIEAACSCPTVYSSIYVHLLLDLYITNQNNIVLPTSESTRILHTVAMQRDLALLRHAFWAFPTASLRVSTIGKIIAETKLTIKLGCSVPTGTSAKKLSNKRIEAIVEMLLLRAPPSMDMTEIFVVERPEYFGCKEFECNITFIVKRFLDEDSDLYSLFKKRGLPTLHAPSATFI